MKFSLFPAFVLSLGLVSISYGGSATWVGESPYYWTTDAYWQPQTPPENPGDVATFGALGVSTCSVPSSALVDIDSIVFSADAQAYAFTIDTSSFTLSGKGIVNNSGKVQSFTVIPYGYPARLQKITFRNEATAGDSVQLTSVGSIEGDVYGGTILFYDQSDAGSALINNQPTKDSDYAGTNFYDSSSAGNATIVNQTPFFASFDSGSTVFADTSTAANANIVNQGGKYQRSGGIVYFEDYSTAGNSTITCEASIGEPYYPATVHFYGNSDGGTARIILYGDGTLDADTVSVGSLEGDGHALISGVLSVGTNNQSTTFDGIIEDSTDPAFYGSLKKVGNGRLILTNANTYHDGTTVESGVLLANNLQVGGSATGAGTVFVTGGTFGGAGSVAGRVLVGTGSGSGATLAPGKSGVKPGTLTIQRRLILEADATYRVTLDSRTSSADKVAAFGASIREASILFNDIGTSVTPIGTVFTLIDNTASTPITGAFINLADGTTVIVGANTFQASYSGGDGNDLTLTVVP